MPVAVLPSSSATARSGRFQCSLRSSQGSKGFLVCHRSQALDSFADGESMAGKGIQPDHHFEEVRSKMFESIFILGGSHTETLRKQGRVVHWVREAFGHLKAIGATGEGINFVEAACEINGMRFSAAGSHDAVDSYGVVTAGNAKPESFRETLDMVKGAKDFIDAYTFTISQQENFDCETDGLSTMVAY